MALLLYFGRVRVSDNEKYWSRQSLFHGLWAREIISCNRRYPALSRYVHVVDHNSEDPDDKLHKVRQMYDALRLRCEELFQPERNLSIDERMVASKGRFGFRQFMPKKPVRFGF